MNKLIKISELSKLLNLVDTKTKKPLNYILRYWEKEFIEIKPKKINNRRYYTSKQVETIRMIKFLLKDKGMTVKGVKNFLNLRSNKLDVYNSHSLKANYIKNYFSEKSSILLRKINKIKKYGKKNSSKS